MVVASFVVAVRSLLRFNDVVGSVVSNVMRDVSSVPEISVATVVESSVRVECRVSVRWVSESVEPRKCMQGSLVEDAGR